MKRLKDNFYVKLGLIAAFLSLLVLLGLPLGKKKTKAELRAPTSTPSEGKPVEVIAQVSDQKNPSTVKVETRLENKPDKKVANFKSATPSYTGTPSSIAPISEPPKSTAAGLTDLSPVNSELSFLPRVGFGGRYLNLKQNGDFGSGEGSGLANYSEIQIRADYEDWNFTTSYQSFTMNLSQDANGLLGTSAKDFKALSMTAGSGSWVGGLQLNSTPLLLISNTYQWGEVNSTSLAAGYHFEKIFSERRKPFSFGFDLTGSYLIGASFKGPTNAKTSGYGFKTKTYAEKSFLKTADSSLIFGVEIFAEYNRLLVDGSWSGFSGRADRSIMGLGSSFYLGAQF